MKDSKTTKTVAMPDVELGKIFAKLRAAMELKYQIMDVLYPRMFMGIGKDMPPDRIDLRDVYRENQEKLEKINKLVREYEP